MIEYNDFIVDVKEELRYAIEKADSLEAAFSFIEDLYGPEQVSRRYPDDNRANAKSTRGRSGGSRGKDKQGARDSGRLKEVKKSLSPANSWGDKLSPGQQRYFKDSKVTDAYGNLILLYHGTMSDFYVFDRTKGNKSGNTGAGFYFTNNEEDVWKHYATPEGPDLK